MPTKKRLPDDQRRLLDHYESLNEADRHTLLSFAAYLAERNEPGGETTADPAPVSLNPIPRPEQESVIKAIKRLSATYPMLPKDKMLDRTSILMMEHVMHGREARSVIDELESIFEQEYRQMNDSAD